METVDDDLESKSLMSKPHEEKQKTTKHQNCSKVAPSLGVPKIAWSNDATACDVEKNIDISFRDKFQDDEKDFLVGDLQDQILEQNLQTPGCKYIKLPMKEDEDHVTRPQYKYLASDDSIFIPFKNKSIVKTKPDGVIKKKLSFLHKYIPYFIVFASIVEVIIYIVCDEDIVKKLMYSPYERREVWRFLSYMLLHSEWIHLILNIIIQTLMAIFLEVEQSWWRCAIIYIGGGLSGSLGTSVLQPSLYMVGASAGVYALLISHIPNVVLRYSSIKYKKFRLFSVFILVVSDVIFSIYHGIKNLNSLPRIGWAAHCAGAVAGLALGFLVYRVPGEERRSVYVKITTVVTFLIFTTYVIGAVVYNLYYTTL